MHPFLSTGLSDHLSVGNRLGRLNWGGELVVQRNSVPYVVLIPPQKGAN